MSLKLAFDLDCVCVNTVDCVINYINERLPVNLKITDIKDYNIESALPEQYRWIVEESFNSAKMWKNVTLLPGCAEKLKQLYDEEYEICFATSSLPQNLRKKINHLTRNLPFFPDDYVWLHTINIHDKYLLNVDILTDDCVKHIIHPERKYWSLAFDYPWNNKEEVDRTPCVTRVHNWDEVYSAIKMIESLIKENENE